MSMNKQSLGAATRSQMEVCQKVQDLEASEEPL